MHKNGDRITVKGISGRTYEYVWKDTPCSGAMKNVFFSPDRKYVVAYFKESQDANAIDRLQNLVTTYTMPSSISSISFIRFKYWV